MNRYGTAIAIAQFYLFPCADVLAQGETSLREEIETLRAEYDRMRDTYESRLRALEMRLEETEAKAGAAEAQAARAAQTAQQARQTASAGVPPRQTKPSEFNPALSVVLEGDFHEFEEDPETFALPGFQLGEETGPDKRGFALGEAEVSMSANVDDWFFGRLTFAFASEEGETEVELEEAFIQTHALPYGFTVRGGRFFSNAGYLNSIHTHADDFLDRPFVYKAFLANQLIDDGLRLSWLAPTDFFAEFGVELLRGDGFPAGGSANRGFGQQVYYVKSGGDIGLDHSLLGGVSHVRSDANGRETEGGDTFAGDSETTIWELVYKWAPGGNFREQNLELQGEYFLRDEDGTYNGVPVDVRQQGWYAQAVFQFMPRWRIGYRRDRLTADAVPAPLIGTVFDNMGHRPSQDSVLLEYAHSDFSRIRLQYNRSRAQSGVTDDQVRIGYTVGIGAHGAHRY